MRNLLGLFYLTALSTILFSCKTVYRESGYGLGSFNVSKPNSNEITRQDQSKVSQPKINTETTEIVRVHDTCFDALAGGSGVSTMGKSKAWTAEKRLDQVHRLKKIIPKRYQRKMDQQIKKNHNFLIYEGDNELMTLGFYLFWLGVLGILIIFLLTKINSKLFWGANYGIFMVLLFLASCLMGILGGLFWIVGYIASNF